MKPIDLERGVVPISRAASSLAALIKLARAEHMPIIMTQKGYPSGVLLGIEQFTALQALVARQGTAMADDDTSAE